MTAAPDDEEIERAIVRVADLLCVVRSNLQHGERFASPDPERLHTHCTNGFRAS
jgi:hypothetical protein